MTRAEVNQRIRAVVLGEDDLAYLNRAVKMPIHAQRAHAVLIAPMIFAFFHACGHTEWVDYSGTGPGRMGEAACAMFAKRWTWRQGGVTAACVTCVPKRKRTGARNTPKVHKGPPWRRVGATDGT